MSLRNVTLACFYNANEALSKRAIRLCTAQADFCSVLEHLLVAPTKACYDRTLTVDFPTAFVDTSHVLVIQYDGYVIDASAWRDEWLEYDYIGAPWTWQRESFSVGNGGFSLRSLRLIHAVRELTARWDETHWSDPLGDDTIICHALRNQLQLEGFKFAPPGVAGKFSFGRTYVPGSFGFHGIYNFPRLMAVDEFYRDIDPLLADYVRASTKYRETIDNFARAHAA